MREHALREQVLGWLKAAPTHEEIATALAVKMLEHGELSSEQARQVQQYALTVTVGLGMIQSVLTGHLVMNLDGSDQEPNFNTTKRGREHVAALRAIPTGGAS